MKLSHLGQRAGALMKRRLEQRLLEVRRGRLRCAHVSAASSTWRAALRPADAHDPAPGMAAGPAQEQARQRRAVLSGARHRPDHEELVEGEFAVVPMAAADPKLLLDVERR